ncbi:hypothetical protein HGRIS_011165 [Hohenbuehelia grisea]|uniref:Uncharacterized protein n=1 Tax=Hohenbuehelia grisea TaxID=104357 RepID=A0ABR3IZD6_9AGAR
MTALHLPAHRYQLPPPTTLSLPNFVFEAPGSNSGPHAPPDLPRALSLLTTALTHTPRFQSCTFSQSALEAGDPLRAAIATEDMMARIGDRYRYLNWRAGVYILRTVGRQSF